eukprot:CAMPEP_0176111884 /NCGR_PEP_ID=MMETSP0120_2-20121206/56186_1 /TAXON_ID=160619 /ORGANISM="Kryptoperidinium foliaceum, Strain CCMP 1326" /LENGTH=777 /DNA_ID=CAMNT_0017446105 /DNA_START=67 /DNA_END=2400 /DNA_ORIENTATION=+
MRVRRLQTYLQEQALVNQGQLEQLRGTRIGVDAVSWLRSIQALKDPFADALGGLPPGIFGFVDKELEAFRGRGIIPLFVFPGITPGPQHTMFVGRQDEQVQQAWSHLACGNRVEAQKCFALSTSRINGDFVYFIFHHLKSRGYECVQAPYFAGAQLAHLAAMGVVSAVHGPPGLLLFEGVERVIMLICFARGVFEWVDLKAIMQSWGVTRDQFLDACMLAGTEYCLTYPYLNLAQLMKMSQQRFNFDAAVFVIKQAPIMKWMSTFPTEEMRRDHVNGYSICKIIVRKSPVMHLEDNTVRPLSGSDGTDEENDFGDPQVPFNFRVIVGDKLPNSLYYLMLNGIISHKLPQALAMGEWTDKAQPLVDTKEFRTLLSETLLEYRETALGLIARHLHRNFIERKILCKAHWDTQEIRRGLPGSENGFPPGARIIELNPTKGLRWNIQEQALRAEMARQAETLRRSATSRQSGQRVDFKFCLNWHEHEFTCEPQGRLIQDLKADGYPTISHDLDSLAALVHFMVLENLGFIDSDGAATVFGAVLKDTPVQFQEPCLVALQMANLEILSGDPFEAVDDKPFPPQVNYPRIQDAGPYRKSIFLLSRVMSLVPMKLKTTEMWNADVDFDLAAFHSVVRIVKRTLRQLVEASLCSALLLDLERVKLLPGELMCASPKKEDHMQTPAVLPTFMLPRTCMGIVVRHFLEYTGDAAAFAKETIVKFPCCYQPIEDLKSAFAFWDDLLRCVAKIGQLTGEELALLTEMNAASTILCTQQQRLGILPSPMS